MLKIADVAADFHALLAKLERDFEDLPETDPTLKKLTTPKIKAKGSIAQSVSPLVVKRAIQRLKDLRKRLPKVAINNVFSTPKSKLEDIEIVLNIDEILAIHFERTARHIEATIPQMSQTQSKKYLDEFLKIRIQVGIPLSKTAQEMIDLLREP